MAWVPAVSVEVVKVARPEALRIEVPSGVVPSKKLTVPVGEFFEGETVTTFAVRVMVWPTEAGLALDESMTAVGTAVTEAVMTWLRGALVAALKLAVAA